MIAMSETSPSRRRAVLFPSSSEYVTHLKDSGIELEVYTVWENFLKRVLPRQEDFDDFNSVWSEIEETEPAVGLISTGVLLCATGKNLTDNNIPPWDARRYNSFKSKVMGKDDAKSADYKMTSWFARALTGFLDCAKLTRPHLK